MTQLEMFKLAREVIYTPREKPDVANHLIPPRGGKDLVDILTSSEMQKIRAGRAQTLAESIDREPGWLLRQPNLTNLLGAGVGGVLGNLTSRQLMKRNLDFGLGDLPALDVEGPLQGKLNGNLGGRMLGSAVGGGIGLNLTRMLRQKAIEDVREDYNQHEGAIIPRSVFKEKLDLAGGSHLLGRTQALKALKDSELTELKAAPRYSAFGRLPARFAARDAGREAKQNIKNLFNDVLSIV